MLNTCTFVVFSDTPQQSTLFFVSRCCPVSLCTVLFMYTVKKGPVFEMNGITAEKSVVCVCSHYYYITSHNVMLGLWERSHCCSGFPPSRPSFCSQDDGQASGHVNANGQVSSVSSCRNELALQQFSVSGTKCTRGAQVQRPENGKQPICCPLCHSTRSTQAYFIQRKRRSTTEHLTWLMVRQIWHF